MNIMKCALGEDSVFGKPAKHLVEINNLLYHFVHTPAIRIGYFGVVRTNRNFQVNNEQDERIPTLSSVPILLNCHQIYTIFVPGGANANNIHSGIVAADTTSYIKN